MPDPTFFLSLQQLALVDVTGADAATFLQGQLSSDVRQASATRAQLASYNSAKGRMLAVLHLWRAGDGFLLELHRSIAEATVRRLKMFVLRSKAALAPATALEAFGLAGDGAAGALGALGLPAPAATLACEWREGACVTRRIGDTPRYTVFVPTAGADNLRERLGKLAVMGSETDWRRLEIAAGVPTVYPQTQDRFVAQMCNLDALGGISFDKGCYTGQEVIARVHYRGAVKRHMTRQRLEGAVPDPGTRLDAGEVVDAVPHPDGGALALVVGAE